VTFDEIMAKWKEIQDRSRKRKDLPLIKKRRKRDLDRRKRRAKTGEQG
jgi:hypothetical protein